MIIPNTNMKVYLTAMALIACLSTGCLSQTDTAHKHSEAYIRQRIDTIYNFGNSKTTIALLFKRDDWYIDDFSPSPDGNDDKQYLRQTILQCQEILEKGQ